MLIPSQLRQVSRPSVTPGWVLQVLVNVVGVINLFVCWYLYLFLSAFLWGAITSA